MKKFTQLSYKQRPGFTFKQFHVAHDGCAMKVGTDGILLGAWCALQQSQRILDVGCGSGLIALMLAQRSAEHVLIDAIDIDADAVHQAQQNVQHSPWVTRIQVMQKDIVNANIALAYYDHLVSNPPFFVHGQSFVDERRAIARQTGTLTHQQLLARAAELLVEDGLLSVILPMNAGEQLSRLACQQGWWVSRATEVITKAGQRVPHRLLLELCRVPKVTQYECLSLYQSDGTYSTAYQHLCRDFYLKM
ncbi:tRNA1(Val) (adenine(37)-N6)-methyltransferase [Celerinatantimonas yamalensis]|uniref:tRNA1(Val) (adenine(37)-N6)-methyltransferase n=1 Tax=Celerinatantimonas yamalensis TaxID=559956 RepID=A0ABW9GAP0_9GAMM